MSSSQSAAPPETVVCILGAPRSGTSLTTRVLGACGLYLGREDELIPPGTGNPAGYWEARRIVDLNERILMALGGSRIDAPRLPAGWENSPSLDPRRREARKLIADIFAGHRTWGWKDPRNSLTLPFWQGLLASMRYVICLRNPLDVAASGGAFAAKQQRDLDRSRAFALWERYLASAVVNTAGRDRLFVSYEDYFEDWNQTVESVTAFAGLDSPIGTDEETAIGNLIDDRLRHHFSPAGEILDDDEVPGGVRSLYMALRPLTGNGRGGTIDGICDAKDEQIDDLARRILASGTVDPVRIDSRVPPS